MGMADVDTSYGMRPAIAFGSMSAGEVIRHSRRLRTETRERSMLELYNAPQSTCSQKVRLTLAEKSLDFVEYKLKLFQNDQLKPEYLKLNPNGVVPTLVDAGVPIIDSSVIMEYLDEEYPTTRLSPCDAKERARMRAWLRCRPVSLLQRGGRAPFRAYDRG